MEMKKMKKAKIITELFRSISVSQYTKASPNELVMLCKFQIITIISFFRNWLFFTVYEHEHTVHVYLHSMTKLSGWPCHLVLENFSCATEILLTFLFWTGILLRFLTTCKVKQITHNWGNCHWTSSLHKSCFHTIHNFHHVLCYEIL